MTKFLMVACLSVVSTLTTACSDKEQAVKDKENTEASFNQNEREAELEKRQKRAEQKGNGLDSFDPNKSQQSPEKEKKSNNGLDSFKPN